MKKSVLTTSITSLKQGVRVDRQNGKHKSAATVVVNKHTVDLPIGCYTITKSIYISFVTLPTHYLYYLSIMPPKKAAESKKADQKKKAKMLEDKTFGLKNKNKSAKVQAYIQSTTKSVMNSGDQKKRKEEEARKKAAAERKALRKAQEEERNALFGEALLAVKKKTTVKTKGESEAKGRDHDAKPEKTGTSKAMKMMFQMDAAEVSFTLWTFGLNIECIDFIYFCI